MARFLIFFICLVPSIAFAELLTLTCTSRAGASSSNYVIDMSTHIVHSSGFRLKTLALIDENRIVFDEDLNGYKFMIVIDRNSGGMEVWNKSNGSLVWDGAYDCSKPKRRF